MPELKGQAAVLWRCRQCAAPISRDDATCPHCGVTDPLASEEGAQVRGSAASTDANLNRARRDFSLALATSRSLAWAVEAYGIPIAVLAFGVLALALAAPVGRTQPLVWFALSAGIPAAATFTLFRLTAPSVEERHRAFLLLGEQSFRCPGCGRPARELPSPSGTVSCDSCGATLAVVPAEEFIRAAARARELASTAERRRRDAEWQAWLRSVSGGSSGLVHFALFATLGLLAVSLLVVSRGAFTRNRPRRGPTVTALSAAAECGRCVPLSGPADAAGLHTGLAVVRTAPGEEGLIVIQGNGPRLEECFAHPGGGLPSSAETLFNLAPWTATLRRSPEDAIRFFSEAYGARAVVSPHPGLPVGQHFTQSLRIRGRSQDWEIQLAPCWFGVAAAAVPADSGASWFTILLPWVLAWGLLALARLRDLF